VQRAELGVAARGLVECETAATAFRQRDRYRDRHKEIRLLKCNGVSPASKKELYGSTQLPTDYLSQVVVLGTPHLHCCKISRLVANQL